MIPCEHEDLIQDLKKDYYGGYNKKGTKMDVENVKTKLNFLFIGVGFIIAQIMTVIYFILKIK